MADNVLKASIVIEAPNVEATAKKVASSVKSMETSLKALPKSSNEAAFALTNLGRVAQDAPFGFIGIQNNLNPLLESFQRLKATTGTTGNAFKALAGSLAGPAGIGFALSAVSSLLVVFGDKLFSSKKGVDEFGEASKKLAEGVSKDLVSLTTIVGLIQNTSASTEDRTKALKLLNEQYGGYLKNIGIEEVTLGNLTKAYDALVDSMLKQAVVKGLQEEITKEVEKTAAEVVKLSLIQERNRVASEKATANFRTQAQKAEDATKAQLDLAKNLSGQFSQGARDGAIAQAGLNQEMAAGLNAAGDYQSRIDGVKKKLLETLAPALNLVKNFSDLGEVLKKPSSTAKDDIIAQAKEIADYFNNRSIRDVKIDFSPFKQDEAANKAKAREFVQAFQKDADAALLTYPLKFNISSRVGIDVSGKDFKQDIAKDAPKLISAVQKEIEDLSKKNRVVAQFQAVLNVKYAFDKKMEKNALDAATAINSAFTNALQGAAEGIGQVLSGENFSKVFVDVIADLISQIGKALLQFGLVKTTLDKILAGGIAVSGAVAIAAGIAAIAAGAALKNAARPKGHRAVGGLVGRDSPYLVGERGPELFVPNTSGTIVPNGGLSGRGGALAGAVQIAGEFRISGNDLIAVLARANRSQGRLS